MSTRTPLASRGAIWFTIPYVIVFALFLVWPILYGLWMSPVSYTHLRAHET